MYKFGIFEYNTNITLGGSIMEKQYLFEPLPLFDRNDENIIVIIEAQARLPRNKVDFDIVAYNKKTKKYLFGEYNEYNDVEYEEDANEPGKFYPVRHEFCIDDESKAYIKKCYANGWTYSTFQFKEIDGKLFIARSPQLGWEEIFDPAEIDKYNIKQGVPLIKDTLQDGFVDNRYK